MSEKINSEMISRRRAFSLVARAAALGVAVPATMLMVSDAEAQTQGSQRRNERRDDRKERRTTRHSNSQE